MIDETTIHAEGPADAVARASRALRTGDNAQRLTAHKELLDLLHREDMGETPLDRLIDAMSPGPDGEDYGHRDSAQERKAALAYLAEHKPLEVLAPPDYPTATEREWLLRNWLPRGRLTLFTGPGGKGKSRLALQLAASLAAGSEQWLHKQPTAPYIAGGAASVVLATYEDEPEEAWRRLEAIQAVMGPRPPGERFNFVDLAGYGALWGPPADSRQPNAPAGLTATGRALRGECETRRARLLIIDPLAGAYNANENDRTAVRSFIASWDRWGRDNDCAVLVIAHPPKERQGERQLYSGSTDWLGGPRSLWVLDAKKYGDSERSARFLCVEKSSYGPDGERIYLSEMYRPGLPPVFIQSPKNEPDYQERGKVSTTVPARDRHGGDYDATK